MGYKRWDEFAQITAIPAGSLLAVEINPADPLNRAMRVVARDDLYADVLGYNSTINAVAGLSTTGLITRSGAGTVVTRSIIQPAAGIVIGNGDGVAGNPTLALANDLAAVEGLNLFGLAARTGADAWAVRSLTPPAAGLAITNADGSAGNPTFALANDLLAVEGLAGTGIAIRTGIDAWATRSLVQPAAGIVVNNGDGVGGDPTLALANDLAAIEGLSLLGMAVRTALDTWAVRAIAGTANQIIVTNGDGVAGNPTLSLPQSIHAAATPTFASLTLTSSITINGETIAGLGLGVASALAAGIGGAGSFVVNGGSLGTPSSGTLTNATGLPLGTGVTGVLAGANGGTGVANTGKSLTLGGNLATSGAFGLVLTLGGETNVSVPTTGTLATLDGIESLTNKTLVNPILSGTVGLAGNITFNGDTLFIDKLNSRVGVNTSTPEATFSVRSQGTGNVRGMLIEHCDNTTAFSHAKYIGERIRGTPGNPSGLLANDSIVAFTSRGYKATGHSETTGGLYVYAAEAWTDNATGTFVTVRGVAPGNTIVSEFARFHSGGATFQGSAFVFGGNTLNTAAYQASTAFATSAQGAIASSAGAVAGIVKGNGLGVFSAAVAGTDYVSPSGSYADPAWITSLAASKISGIIAAGNLPVPTATTIGGVARNAGGVNQFVQGIDASGFLVYANLPYQGTVTSVSISGGTTGLSFAGGPITTSGTITMSGVLDAANGGAGSVSGLLKANGLGVVSAAIAGTDYEAAIAAGTAGHYWRGDKTWQTLNASAVGLGSVTNDAQVKRSEMGVALGVATLAADGKLSIGQLPAIAITEFLGSVASEAAMLMLVGQKGDWVIRSDQSTMWIIVGNDPTLLSSWQAIAYPGGGGSGSVTSIDISGGTTGLSFTGGPITTSGTITMSGVLGSNNGGAGSVSGILRANGLGVVSAAAAGVDFEAVIAAGTAAQYWRGDKTWQALNAASVGLGSVTNDLQTKAAIVPNTVPTQGQILIGNIGGTAYSPVSVTGDISISHLGATTLATVNPNVGSFGSATVVPVITVNGKGLITAVATAAIAPALGSITGFGVGVATALAINVGTTGSVVVNGGALGTPLSGTLTNATGLPLDTGVTGVLTFANGGTNATTVVGARSSLLPAYATNAGRVLAVNGTATDVEWVIAADVSSNTATSVDGEIVLFSGIGGKTIKRATTSGVLKGTAGVISAAVVGTDYEGPIAIGTTAQYWRGDKSWQALNAAAVGLGSVTNDAQTKASIVPNTAPLAGQILIGNLGGTAYAPVSMSGDATIDSTGAITIGAGAVGTSKLGGDITAAGKALLDDATVADQRTTLGLGTLATQSGTFSGTSSGTNTGDQTITLTGDVGGSGTGSFTTTLATVNANVGSYGSATASVSFTVDGKGRLTAAGSTTITPAIGSVTGLGTGVATALGNAVNVANGLPTLDAGAKVAASQLPLPSTTTLGGVKATTRPAGQFVVGVNPATGDLQFEAGGGSAGGDTTTTLNAGGSLVLTSASQQMQTVKATAVGTFVQLADATTLTKGPDKTVVSITADSYPVGIKDGAGNVLGQILAGDVVRWHLSDVSAAQGTWSRDGNVDPWWQVGQGYISNHTNGSFFKLNDTTYLYSYLTAETNTPLKANCVTVAADGTMAVGATVTLKAVGAPLHETRSYVMSATNRVLVVTNDHNCVLVDYSAAPTLTVGNVVQMTSASYYGNVVDLDGRYLVFIRTNGGTNRVAVCLDAGVSGTTLTLGTETSWTDPNGYDYCTVDLTGKPSGSSIHAAFFGKSYDTASQVTHFRLASVTRTTGTTLSWNTGSWTAPSSYTTSSASTQNLPNRAEYLSDKSKFLFLYRHSSDATVRATVGTFAEVPSFTAPFSTGLTWQSSYDAWFLLRCGTDKFLAHCNGYDGNQRYAQVLSVSGTTITSGTAVDLVSGDTGQGGGSHSITVNTYGVGVLTGISGGAAYSYKTYPFSVSGNTINRGARTLAGVTGFNFLGLTGTQNIYLAAGPSATKAVMVNGQSSASGVHNLISPVTISPTTGDFSVPLRLSHRGLDGNVTVLHRWMDKNLPSWSLSSDSVISFYSNSNGKTTHGVMIDEKIITGESAALQYTSAVEIAGGTMLAHVMNLSSPDNTKTIILASYRPATR